MKYKDLGIDVKMGYHDRRLTPAEEAFVGIMWPEYSGEDNKISADELAYKFADWHGVYLLAYGRKLDYWKREVRYMQSHLLDTHNNIPIISEAGTNGGYYIAETEEELNKFHGTFIRRAKTGFRKATRAKQATYVDVVKQMTFEFDEFEDRTSAKFPIKPSVSSPTPVEVVYAILDKMTKNPEKFADGLRKIGQKYGSLLLDKQQVAEVQAAVRKAMELVDGFGVRQ